MWHGSKTPYLKLLTNNLTNINGITLVVFFLSFLHSRSQSEC